MTRVTVYRLYGHYSFKSRDGGIAMTLELSDGYNVGEWIHGGPMIIGPKIAVSVEQALYHGFARVAP